MPLDPDDQRPPYLQIAQDLRESITSGALAPGEQLPSTSKLAQRYGVANMTIRSAMRILNDEGLVVARQGTGVFVRTARPGGPDAKETLPLETVMQQLDELSAGFETLARRLDELEALVRRSDEPH